jgi:hypothetical protein
MYVVVPPVTVTVLVLLVYCIVVNTPWTVCVTVDRTVVVTKLVVKIVVVIVTLTSGAKKEAPA